MRAREVARETAGGYHGNAALGTVLFAELFFNPSVKWGVVVCSGASLLRAYYLTEWTSPRHVGDVSRSKACWVGPPGDGDEPVWNFSCYGRQILIIAPLRSVIIDGFRCRLVWSAGGTGNAVTWYFDTCVRRSRCRRWKMLCARHIQVTSHDSSLRKVSLNCDSHHERKLTALNRFLFLFFLHEKWLKLFSNYYIGWLLIFCRSSNQLIKRWFIYLLATSFFFPPVRHNSRLPERSSFRVSLVDSGAECLIFVFWQTAAKRLCRCSSVIAMQWNSNQSFACLALTATALKSLSASDVRALKVNQKKKYCRIILCRTAADIHSPLLSRPSQHALYHFLWLFGVRSGVDFQPHRMLTSHLHTFLFFETSLCLCVTCDSSVTLPVDVLILHCEATFFWCLAPMHLTDGRLGLGSLTGPILTGALVSMSAAGSCRSCRSYF